MQELGHAATAAVRRQRHPGGAAAVEILDRSSHVGVDGLRSCRTHGKSSRRLRRMVQSVECSERRRHQRRRHQRRIANSSSTTDLLPATRTSPTHRRGRPPSAGWRAQQRCEGPGPRSEQQRWRASWQTDGGLESMRSLQGTSSGASQPCKMCRR